MSGGEAEARAKGGNAVVVTGGSVFGGDADGGPGVGAYGGGWGSKITETATDDSLFG